jgi:hypothetical protein
MTTGSEPSWVSSVRKSRPSAIVTPNVSKKRGLITAPPARGTTSGSA